MTRQILRAAERPDVTGCAKCGQYWDSGLFELCLHAESKYLQDGHEEHHTVQHMRGEYGPCGPGKRLATGAKA